MPLKESEVNAKFQQPEQYSKFNDSSRSTTPTVKTKNM